MRQWITAWIAVLSGLCLTVSTSCISPAIHKNVPAFAEAVTIATENSKGAFDVVEAKYADVEADKLVVNYDTKGFDPRMVKRFLDPEDLNTRLILLDALQRYASTLADVSSDQKLQEFDGKTQAFGAALRALTTTPAFQKLASASNTEINIATVAVDALGRWFIERKRQQRLPELIQEMQEPVRRTAELLQADIGDAPDINGAGGRGLRDQLWLEYTDGLVQEVAFIDKNKDRMDPNSKAAEIRKLPQLVRQRFTADQTLKQTSEALAKLVVAHSALLQATRTNTDVHAEFSALISEGQRIKAFYESLQKKD